MKAMNKRSPSLNRKNLNRLKHQSRGRTNLIIKNSHPPNFKSKLLKCQMMSNIINYHKSLLP